MANTLRFKRGLVSGIPTAALGEPLFTTDTFDLYIGNGTGNTRFQKYIASGATTQILRGDGSLYTFPLNISSPSNGQVLKYDGTNWVNSADAGVTGSGAAGQVTYWGSASTITGSNNLFWDATNNRLGIGNNTPTRRLDITSDGTNWISGVFAGSGGTDKTVLGNLSSGATIGGHNSSLSAWANFNIVASNIIFKSNGENDRGRIHSSGNWLIGTSTDQGYKLDVVGTLRSTTTTYLATNTGNVLVGSTTDNGLRFQVTGDGYFSGSVGIGSSGFAGRNISVEKTITGNTIGYGIIQVSNVQSDVTSGARAFYSQIGTQAAAFTLPELTHYYAVQGTFGAGSTVTSQFGYRVFSNLTGATNNYGFYGDIASGTGRWNLYMNGSAANYTAGALSVGHTVFADSSNSNWRPAIMVGQSGTDKVILGYLVSSTNGAVVGAVNSANSAWANLKIAAAQLIFSTTGETERMRLDASGNLGLGVTPSAWLSTDKAIQLSTTASIVGTTGSILKLGNNFYFNGNNVYLTSAAATLYQQSSGNHLWYNAPSGTAGANITFTQAMTLFATGNLAVGTTTDAGFKLDVNGTMRVSGASTFNGTATVSGKITAGDASAVAGQMTLEQVYSAGNVLGSISTQWGTGAMVLGYGARGKSGANGYTSTFSNFSSRRAVLEIGQGTLQFLNTASVNTAVGSDLTTTLLFSIADTGAATFSSSVTATSYNGIVIQRGGGSIATNTGVGSGVLTLNTTGFGNLALGYFGLYSNTTGYYNTSVGYDALYSNTDGFENVAIGFRALYNNTTGDDNIAIGYRAGWGGVANGNTTGNNNIFIGYNIAGVNATDSNRTFIGSSTTTSTWLGGNLLLGTTTDSGYRLRVNGTSYFDDNLRFPNAKGILFENASASPVGSIKIGLGATSPLEITNGTHTITLATLGTFVSSNLLVGASTIGLSSTNTIAVASGTAPTSSATDIFHLYSADVVAGNAAPHFRTENGAIIKLYQETTSVGNSIMSLGGGTPVLDDTTFDGYTLKQIVKALRNQGILA